MVLTTKTTVAVSVILPNHVPHYNSTTQKMARSSGLLATTFRQLVPVFQFQTRRFSCSITQEIIKCKGNFKKAEMLLNTIEKQRKAIPLSAYQAMVKSCAQSRQPDRIIELLVHMSSPSSIVKPDMECYRTGIVSCTRSKKWRQSLKLLNRMEQEKVKPDIVCLSSAMNACKVGGQYQTALDIFFSLEQHGIKPDLIMCNNVISACEKGGLTEEGLRIFGSMEKYGIEPDAITCTAVICLYGRIGNWERALELFEKLEANSIVPDLLVYQNLIKALARAGQLEKTLFYFDSLKHKGFLPNDVIFNAVIDVCGQYRQWERALEIFDSMTKFKVSPNVHTFNKLITCLEISGQFDLSGEKLKLALAKGVYKTTWVDTSSTPVCFQKDTAPLVARCIMRLIISDLKKNKTVSSHIKIVFTNYEKGMISNEIKTAVQQYLWSENIEMREDPLLEGHFYVLTKQVLNSD
jgi:pentatricopeptide repeat protein